MDSRRSGQREQGLGALSHPAEHAQRPSAHTPCSHAPEVPHDDGKAAYGVVFAPLSRMRRKMNETKKARAREDRRVTKSQVEDEPTTRTQLHYYSCRMVAAYN